MMPRPTRSRIKKLGPVGVSGADEGLVVDDASSVGTDILL
jgi:hypothetical protein